MGAIRNFSENAMLKIFSTLEPKMRRYCDEVVEAAYRFRTSEPYAHNFTGNLLNSIVCLLYKRGKLVYASYLHDTVKGPIHGKMTATYRGYPQKYDFKQDYDSSSSHYEASVWTNEGYGYDDAKRFASEYPPRIKDAFFEMVLAYTTEYATFVEAQRHTTGYLQTSRYVIDNALKVINFD